MNTNIHIFVFSLFVVQSKGYNASTEQPDILEEDRLRYRQAVVSVLGLNHYL